MDLFKIKTYLLKYEKAECPLSHYYDFEIKDNRLYCYLIDSKGEDPFDDYGFYCIIHIVKGYDYITIVSNARERWKNVERYTSRKALAEMMAGQINKKGGKNGKIK